MGRLDIGGNTKVLHTLSHDNLCGKFCYGNTRRLANKRYGP